MKILFAAPISFHRYTLFISHYVSGLAKAAKQLGHFAKIVKTTENNYNPLLWKPIEKEFAVIRYLFKPLIDLPHDLLLMRQVYKEIIEYKPDLLFMHLLDTSCFHLVMEKIKQTGCRTAVWLGIHPSKVSSGIHKLLKKSDFTFIYDYSYEGKFHDLGINNVHIAPLGCDIKHFQQDENRGSEKYNSHDVCFAGLFDRYREKYLNALADFDLGIWSWNIENYSTPLIKYHRGVAYGEELYHLFKSSKIVINIHRNFEISGGNYRLFEIPACGAFQIVDDKKDIGNYFEVDKEIVTFKDRDDLRYKVKYYLRHEKERKQIARAGLERLKKDHTLSNRMSRILNIVNEL